MPPASPGDEDMGKPAQVGGLNQLPGLAWARARALATHMLRTGKKFRNTGQWEKMPRQDSSNNSISTKSDPKGASYITTHLHTYTAHQKEAAQCTAKLPSSPGAPRVESTVWSHTQLLAEPRGRLMMDLKKSAGLPHLLVLAARHPDKALNRHCLPLGLRHCWNPHSHPSALLTATTVVQRPAVLSN